MKYVKRMSKGQYVGAMDAVNATVKSIGAERFTVKSWAMVDASIVLIDSERGQEVRVSIHTDGADFYCTPDFMLDWVDGEWSGVSANGADFTIWDSAPLAV